MTTTASGNVTADPAPGRRRSVLLGTALLAAVTANLIHNDFGIDPAIAPALVLGALYAWRPARPLLWATAIVIALPSILFFQASALTDPGNVRSVANHVALLLAGLLAAAAAGRDLWPGKG